MTNQHLDEVDPDRRAEVVIDNIVVARQRWAVKNRRPPALTAREALIGVQFECLVIWTACANARNGVPLSDEDFERLTLAQRRIDTIVDEVA